MTFVLHAASILLLHAAAATTTADSGHWMQFAMNRTGVTVPNYVISLRQEDGRGWYSPSAGAEEATRVPITATPTTLTKVFTPKDQLHDCETHGKNIANTGKKTLKYQNGSAIADCTFNYSDNESLNAAAGTFQAIAATMEAGARLEHYHRFDRLGLDEAIDTLIDELKNGLAIEVGNIAPTLKSLAKDDRVMDRVRRKAARLLEEAGLDNN